MPNELMSLEDIDNYHKDFPGLPPTGTRKLVNTAIAAHELKKDNLRLKMQLNESIIHARTNANRVMKLIDDNEKLKNQLANAFIEIAELNDHI